MDSYRLLASCDRLTEATATELTGAVGWSPMVTKDRGDCQSDKLEEEKGFEPLDVLPSAAFKAAALDHSAILPLLNLWREWRGSNP